MRATQIKIQQRDILDILIYAFRYALGRSSYAVSTVIGVIIENAQNLTDSDLKLYIQEIKEAIKIEHCGMEMDCRSWQRLAEHLQDELNSRNGYKC